MTYLVPYLELRVCVLGSADVGKSTLLGVLTQVWILPLFHVPVRTGRVGVSILISIALEYQGNFAEKFVL
jgi:hypothetical protein